jgi:hypothetical protein
LGNATETQQRWMKNQFQIMTVLVKKETTTGFRKKDVTKSYQINT